VVTTHFDSASGIILALPLQSSFIFSSVILSFYSILPKDLIFEVSDYFDARKEDHREYVSNLRQKEEGKLAASRVPGQTEKTKKSVILTRERPDLPPTSTDTTEAKPNGATDGLMTDTTLDADPNDNGNETSQKQPQQQELPNSAADAEIESEKREASIVGDVEVPSEKEFVPKSVEKAAAMQVVISVTCECACTLEIHDDISFSRFSFPLIRVDSALQLLRITFFPAKKELHSLMQVGTLFVWCCLLVVVVVVVVMLLLLLFCFFHYTFHF
jgi:hypothetical protein